MEKSELGKGKIEFEIEKKCGENQKAKGRWTKEEHEKFVEALKKYGKNWKMVEKCLETRSGAQIRSHAQKFFNRIDKLTKVNNENIPPSHQKFDLSTLIEKNLSLEKGPLLLETSSEDPKKITKFSGFNNPKAILRLKDVQEHSVHAQSLKNQNPTNLNCTMLPQNSKFSKEEN